MSEKLAIVRIGPLSPVCDEMTLFVRIPHGAHYMSFPLASPPFDHPAVTAALYALGQAWHNAEPIDVAKGGFNYELDIDDVVARDAIETAMQLLKQLLLRSYDSLAQVAAPPQVERRTVVPFNRRDVH